MAVLTIRNLPDHIHQALRDRAAGRGHSSEDEVREILMAAVGRNNPLGMGDALSALGRAAGLKNADLDVVDQVRLASPAPPRAMD